MGKKVITHYIGSEWNSKFIIAKTDCGIYWKDCDDFSSDIEYVTCKKCLKSIQKKQLKNNYENKSIHR